mmetsp:Transcript_57557/g.149593  ORF Transcript_57557/g.149593 Transcript_57557/m.149593 type:complete len:415 (+) Transcript_57557:353-1597(+)
MQRARARGGDVRRHGGAREGREEAAGARHGLGRPEPLRCAGRLGAAVPDDHFPHLGGHDHTRLGFDWPVEELHFGLGWRERALPSHTEGLAAPRWTEGPHRDGPDHSAERLAAVLVRRRGGRGAGAPAAGVELISPPLCYLPAASDHLHSISDPYEPRMDLSRLPRVQRVRARAVPRAAGLHRVAAEPAPVRGHMGALVRRGDSDRQRHQRGSAGGMHMWVRLSRRRQRAREFTDHRARHDVEVIFHCVQVPEGPAAVAVGEPALRHLPGSFDCLPGGVEEAGREAHRFPLGGHARATGGGCVRPLCDDGRAAGQRFDHGAAAARALQRGALRRPQAPVRGAWADRRQPQQLRQRQRAVQEARVHRLLRLPVVFWRRAGRVRPRHAGAVRERRCHELQPTQPPPRHAGSPARRR